MSNEPKPNIRPGVRGICRNGFWTPPLESGPFDRVMAGQMYWTSRGQYEVGMESPWDIIGIVEDLPTVPSPPTLKELQSARGISSGMIDNSASPPGYFVPAEHYVPPAEFTKLKEDAEKWREHCKNPHPATHIPGMPE